MSRSKRIRSNTVNRSNSVDRRRVFRPTRKRQVTIVLRQLIVILLMLAGGLGIAVALHQLPTQVDVMLLVSEAIADLIRGIQQLLEAILGLGAVVLIAALVVLATVLVLGALWRLLRLLKILLFARAQGRR